MDSVRKRLVQSVSCKLKQSIGLCIASGFFVLLLVMVGPYIRKTIVLFEDIQTTCEHSIPEHHLLQCCMGERWRVSPDVELLVSDKSGKQPIKFKVQDESMHWKLSAEPWNRYSLALFTRPLRWMETGVERSIPLSVCISKSRECIGHYPGMVKDDGTLILDVGTNTHSVFQICKYLGNGRDPPSEHWSVLVHEPQESDRFPLPTVELDDVFETDAPIIPLAVSNVTGRCFSVTGIVESCDFLSFPRTPILVKPKTTTHITVKMNPANVDGDFFETIWLCTDSSEYPTIPVSFVGTVSHYWDVKPHKRQIHFNAHDPFEFELTPNDDALPIIWHQVLGPQGGSLEITEATNGTLRVCFLPPKGLPKEPHEWTIHLMSLLTNATPITLHACVLPPLVNPNELLCISPVRADKDVVERVNVQDLIPRSVFPNDGEAIPLYPGKKGIVSFGGISDKGFPEICLSISKAAILNWEEKRLLYAYLPRFGSFALSVSVKEQND